MIGLEFIYTEFGMPQKILAEKLKILPTNITNWVSGTREIPKKTLPKLSEIFNNIPIEYFQKELTHADKLKIKIFYIENMDEEERFGRNYFDDEDGKQVIEIVDQFIDTLESLKVELGNVERLDRIADVTRILFMIASEVEEHKLKHDFNGINIGGYLESNITDYLDYHRRMDIKQMNAVKVVIDFLRQHFGKNKNKTNIIDIFPNEKQLAFYKDLEDVLTKHNVI